MIKREKELSTLGGLLERHRIVGIIGARQVGKSTLIREYLESVTDSSHFFDLENPEDEARLADPMLALGNLEGIVAIDEIQRLPDIFPILRVLADRTPNPARFIVLGSASPDLLKQSSETLAGRIYYHELGGFSMEETGAEHMNRLWFRGGMPRSYLARSQKESHEWRMGYIRTFLERDLPQLGINTGSVTMRRLWTMLAHYHGQTWNASEFGRAFGVADNTVRSHLDKLTAALVVKQLLPWHENIAKRQVKAPKVYVSDSGILHALLNLRSASDVEGHPKVGASWEGFAINQIINHLGAEPEECFFWATHGGAELDLMVVRGNKRLGFEIKRTSAPRTTPSMRHALEDLKLDSLHAIHAGQSVFPLAERITAVPLHELFSKIEPL